MTLGLNALQKAIYERLTAQLDPVPVFDHVPQGDGAPYVVIGNDTTIPWDTKSEDGQEYSIMLHVWDRPVAGRKSVKEIMGRIYAALHHQEEALAVEGFAVVLMRYDFTDTMQDTSAPGEQDQYYHGVMRFRALVEDI